MENHTHFSESVKLPTKTARADTVFSESNDEYGRRPTYAKKRKEKKDVVFYTNFEEVLQKIGAFGPYQIFCFIVILYASIEWAGEFIFIFCCSFGKCMIFEIFIKLADFLRTFLALVSDVLHFFKCFSIGGNLESYRKLPVTNISENLCQFLQMAAYSNFKKIVEQFSFLENTINFFRLSSNLW